MRQIVFLDFLLKKFQNTPLVEALRIALPILFEINLSTKIDHENIHELVDYLDFISKNKINDKCTMNVISALTLHGTNIAPEQAVNILVALADLNRYQREHFRLLQNSYSIILNNIDKLSFDVLEFALTKVVEKIGNKVYDFYNEDFINRCADMAIQQDVGFLKSIYILKKLNKISFVHLGVLNYIVKHVESNPNLLIDCRFTILYTFVSAFSTANYCPSTWCDVSKSIYQNTIFQSDKTELPWIRFSLELMSLNSLNNDLLNKIFEYNFLMKYLARANYLLDYLQLLLLYQCSKILLPDYEGNVPEQEFLDKAINISFNYDSFPLKAMLEHGFSNEKCVLTKVKSKHGLLIDHIVAFSDGQPIHFDDFDCELEELQTKFKNSKL